MSLFGAQNCAIAEKLNDVEAAKQLAGLRAGDGEAAGRLAKGLAYLIYETAFAWSHRSGKRRPDDIVGSLYVGLCKAIERLAKNAASDPVAFVKQELERRIHAGRRERSRDILPSPQANAYRRREGLPLYRRLTRVECDPHEDVETSVMEQATYRGPELSDDYRAYRGPSKHYNWADAENMVDLRDQLGDDPDLMTVAELTLAGHTIEEIIAETGLTEYRVRRHRREIGVRLRGDEPASVELARAVDASVHPAELELALAV